jgi:alcohol dehydrogenase
LCFRDVSGETGLLDSKKEVTDKDGRQMVPKEKLPNIARTASSDRSIFYNPEEVDYEDFLMVLAVARE